MFHAAVHLISRVCITFDPHVTFFLSYYIRFSDDLFRFASELDLISGVRMRSDSHVFFCGLHFSLGVPRFEIRGACTRYRGPGAPPVFTDQGYEFQGTPANRRTKGEIQIDVFGAEKTELH